MTRVPYDTLSRTLSSAKFSCCLPLRVLCFVLGYLNLISNTFYTLALLIFTSYLGISTHGFDHFDDERAGVVTDPHLEFQPEMKPALHQTGILLIVLASANVIWVLLIVTCLVGLHKKSPGPIRIYAGFATARLLLAFACFVFLIVSSNINSHAIFANSFELGLSGYFILVYYLHAAELEREQLDDAAAPQPQPELNAGNIAFIYPTKMDKQILVA